MAMLSRQTHHRGASASLSTADVKNCHGGCAGLNTLSSPRSTTLMRFQTIHQWSNRHFFVLWSPSSTNQNFTPSCTTWSLQPPNTTCTIGIDTRPGSGHLTIQIVLNCNCGADPAIWPKISATRWIEHIMLSGIFRGLPYTFHTLKVIQNRS